MATQFVADIADPADAPWRSVVFVEATFPDGNTFTGSGVVVGRNDVLTASHVVFSEPNGGVAQSVTVFPGRDRSQSPFGSFGAETIDYLPWDLDGDGLLLLTESAQDFAVLGFDEPLGDETGWFGIDPDATTGDYNLTGYPGAFFENGQPRMTTDSGEAERFASPGVWISTEIDSNPGNSGGPLWYDADGIPFVVGVLSAGDGTTNVSGNVLAQFETITGWMAANDSLLGGSDTIGDDIDVGDGTPVDDGVVVGTDAVAGVRLEGTVRNDTMTAGAGNDVLVGGAGADLLDGGTGVDWAFYTTSTLGVTVDLSGGSAGSGGDAQGDRLTSIENVRGSAVGDTLTGSAAANIVEGGAGDDTITGNAGGDLLRGGHGDDTVSAGAGADAAVGGPGNDVVNGGAGDDALRGNSQNDRLDGGAGSDRVYGNIGGDTVRGGDGDDHTWGLSGNDRLDGGAGTDWLYGGWGGDVLMGGPDPDFLRGDGGRDVFQFDTSGGMPDTILDLETAGSDHDLIDLHRWFLATGYDGTTPVSDGIVRVLTDGPYARIQVQDADRTWASVAIAADTSADILADDRYFVTGDDYWFWG